MRSEVPMRDRDQPLTVAKTEPELERAVHDVWARDPWLVVRPGHIYIGHQEFRVIGPGHYRPVSA
jgi:hypothetical protein